MEQIRAVVPNTATLNVVTTKLLGSDPASLQRFTVAVMKTARLFERDEKAWTDAMSARRPDLAPGDLDFLWNQFPDAWGVNGFLNLAELQKETDFAYQTTPDFEGLPKIGVGDWVDTRMVDEALKTIGVYAGHDDPGQTSYVKGDDPVKNGFRVIDSELHLMEPHHIWEERLPEPYRSMTHIVPPSGLSERLRVEYGSTRDQVHDGATSEIRGLVRRLSEKRMANTPRLAYAAVNCRPEIWLEDMDLEGIDIAVLLPTPTMSIALVDGLDPRHAIAMSRVYNDWAAEFCAANPERLKFWAWLPRHDAELAAEESLCCMEELGAVGVAFSTHTVDDHLLSDTFYDPLWAELNRLEAPIGMHVTGSAKRDNIRTRYQGHARTEVLMRAIGGVYYSMTSVGELILGGVLERFPDIKPVVMETSVGWVPWLLWRMDDMWELFGPHAGYSLELEPSEYFRRQCYVVADSDDGMVRHAIDSGLGQCVLFSGDYPHPDSPYPDAVKNFLSIADLTDTERHSVLWDNGARLFKIKAAEGEGSDSALADVV